MPYRDYEFFVLVLIAEKKTSLISELLALENMILGQKKKYIQS